MKKFLLYALLVFTVASCGDEQNQTTENAEDSIEVDPDQFLPIEKRAKRHIERTLGIPANEKYSYKIYKKELNGDGKEDAIITVNRLEFALKTAENSPNPAQMAEIGFMGNYNYFFYFDGSSRKISHVFNIPSTPQKELEVTFQHITSETYFDFIVKLRIRNSCFANFFTVSGEVPSSFFYWKVFDGVGTDKLEAFDFKYSEGKVSPRKNINITKARLELPDGEFDPYTVDPKIIAGDKIEFTFFYLPAKSQYVTMKE